MKRGKMIAAACALAAVALAVCGAFSYMMIPSFTGSWRDRDVFVLHFFDGRVRVFWLHSPIEPIRVEAAEYHGIIYLHSQTEDLGRWDDDRTGPPPPPWFRVPIRIGDRLSVPPVGGAWRVGIGPRPSPPWGFSGTMWVVESSFLRLPVWPLAILLVVPPIQNSIYERRRLRRKKRNECLDCGYNLTGLIEPRCPECGCSFTRSLQ